MGMYDTVVLEKKYKKLKWKTFQTKQLGKQLDVYHITPEGRLVKQYVDTLSTKLDINYHGTFEMCASNSIQYCLYEAVFYDGDLIEIKPIKNKDKK